MTDRRSVDGEDENLSGIQGGIPGQMISHHFTPCELLRICVRRIYAGPWKLIQLRGVPLCEVEFNSEDVDLLGTEESARELMNAAFEWVAAEECCLRVMRRSNRKLTLILYSTDGIFQLQLDLWIKLPQIGRGRWALTFDGVSEEARFETTDPETGRASSSILRLVLQVEVRLYLQHLVCKKKDINAERVRIRLRDYESKLSSIGELDEAAVISRVLQSGVVDRHAESESLGLLANSLILDSPESQPERRLQCWWLDGFHRLPRMVAVIGCDGSGKTSIAQLLQSQSSGMVRHVVGKHLYRKSLLYKLLVIFVRPLVCRDRERFDEMLAPLIYLIASFRLRILRHWWRGIFVVFDRCLSDFLYLNRKSDKPAYSRWVWLTKWIGVRPTVVHLLVADELLGERRREVTSAGHVAYDRDFLQHLTQRLPTDYVAVSNNGDILATTDTVTRILAVPRLQPKS